ncbi:MAG: GWxTD domain-containing protein, partial [Candidatus Aminicenantes bacterium]|nr:GWxTD domain-containing protein [Candidatus Aminicenantes bacterium]
SSGQVTSLKPKDLPEAYYRWLEEEVAYIMSPTERDVFLKLQSDRERDIFIEAFWKHRDPEPGTEENEFRREHYRRLGHANRYYGRAAPLPGWKTDRGRVYIILGEPNDIQRFEGQTQTYPSEIWFYQNQDQKGLPSGFNLVFFRQHGIGDYELYNPLEDGPMALMTSYYGDPMDYQAAYKQLHEYEPVLANASLSLIPGDASTALGRPSLSSQMLLQQLDTVAWRMVEDKYARKLLEYKDIVEVEYSANYIASDGLVRVYQECNGMYFVHYALQPARLSVSEHEGRYSTIFRVNGILTEDNGKPVHQFEKTVSVSFDRNQMQDISRRPFIIHDMFPLVEGSFRMSVLAKNEVSKEFTTMEQRLNIPSRSAGPVMMPLLLGYNSSAVPVSAERLKPFHLAGRQFYAQPDRIFLRSETLSLAFQVTGLTEAQLSVGEVLFVILQDGKEFRTTARPASAYPSAPAFFESIPLSEFPPAHYKVTVSYRFDGRELASASEEFGVTHLESIPRPWVYAKVVPGPDDPSHLYLTGAQLYRQGRLEEALVRMERAVALAPDSAEFVMNLAQVYLSLKDYQKVDTLLSPLLSQDTQPAYELYVVLGRALQAGGQFARAIEILDKAIADYGVNTVLLNAIGECYTSQNKSDEARVVWEKSLILDPDQPAVKKRLEELKSKK